MGRTRRKASWGLSLDCFIAATLFGQRMHLTSCFSACPLVFLNRTKDLGKEPKRSSDEYRWFRSGKVFPADRVNDIRLTNVRKKK